MKMKKVISLCVCAMMALSTVANAAYKQDEDGWYIADLVTKDELAARQPKANLAVKEVTANEAKALGMGLGKGASALNDDNTDFYQVDVTVSDLGDLMWAYQDDTYDTDKTIQVRLYNLSVSADGIKFKKSVTSSKYKDIAWATSAASASKLNIKWNSGTTEKMVPENVFDSEGNMTGIVLPNESMGTATFVFAFDEGTEYKNVQFDTCATYKLIYPGVATEVDSAVTKTNVVSFAPAAPAAKLDRVVITGDSALKMGATETTTLTAKAYDTDEKEMSDATFTWAVAEGADVVEVNNGVVTAKKAGTAKVTATTTIGEVTRTGEIDITVAPEAAKLSKIVVSADSTTVEEGKTLNVKATGKDQYDADFAIDGVVWTSSDEDVATVENGVVTAKKAGTAKIKATVGEFSDEIEITVTAAPIPELEILINGATGIVPGTQVKNGAKTIGYVWKVLLKNYKAGNYTAKFTAEGESPKTAGINELPDVEGNPNVSFAVILNTGKDAVSMGIDYAE